MIFSSLLFVYFLLPVSLLVYYLLPDVRKKNLALIVISLLVYAMGQPLYVPLMVGLCFVNYRFALRIDPEDRSTILLPVVTNVALLVGFKYFALLLDTFGVEIGSFEILPVGLSVFTFSAVSYLLDVYNGRVEPEDNFSNLLLYFLMFPKLPVGPIVPYAQMRRQLECRRHSPRTAFEGFQRFVFGLAKKVLLADGCGRLLAHVNGAGADATLVGVWFAAILFMFRIYYDFSGCCDMAIGLGKIFGFRYCENFNRPYMALSVTEFAQRWNMSLGAFFREYVYLPLGGGELGAPRKAVNILGVCLLVGVWYGAGWNYLAWALYLGVILAAESYLKPSMDFWPDWLCRTLTLWLLLFGWIIFEHESLADFKAAMAAILGYGGFGVPGLGRWIAASVPMLLACVLGCTNLPLLAKRIFAGVCGMDRRRGNDDGITVLRIVYVAISLVTTLTLLFLCTVALTKFPGLMPIYSKF